jgi:hypothetical protein
MMRSLLKRVERLEAQQANMGLRDALIETLSDWDGERHLAMVSADAGRCIFQERRGPGPQLGDFGKFGWVLRLSTAEMNL